MIGKTLGKYRIVEKIGRGGMGVVYLALDETLDRQVAIKAISPELVEEDLVRRFRAEAVTLAKVNHRNIATVYELFRDDDRLLMVMELVRGQTFEELIDHTGPMPFDRAASLAGQILDALGHAHRAGIVHRDLKPANLMLTDAGIVKVMDFGIARVAGTERMTSDGLMVGTPAYMAPEQVRGEEVDGRTDLYAVGVVFYRLLTGKLPFKAETAVAMIQSQLNDQPTPARQVRSDLPDWLDTVLMRSLAKRPADRYQTAEEFRRALDALDGFSALPEDITVVTPSAPMARATVIAAAAGRGNTPAPRHEPAPGSAATPAAGSHTTTLVLNRSHLAVAGGFGGLLLIVIGLLGWLALRNPAAVPRQVVTVPPSAPAAPPVTAAAPPTSTLQAAPPAASPSAAAPVVVPPNAKAADLPPAPPAAPSPPKAPKPAVTEAVVARPSEPAAASPSSAAAAPRNDVLPSSRGRGAPPAATARGGRATTPPPVAVEFAPVVLRKLHAVSVVGGRTSRMVEVIVAFTERGVTATDSDSGLTVKTIPYSAVTHATMARSVKPRGAGGKTLDTPGGIPEGRVFARGPRLWVAIETADDQLLLRLDSQQVRPVLDLIGERIKVPLESYMQPEP